MELSISLVSGSEMDVIAALKLFFALCIGHAIADFPLQGDFLSRGKNRHLSPPKLADGSPPKRMWMYLMSAHALTHAGFVWLITGNGLLAFMEFVLHSLIDMMKCDGRTGFESDQWLHIATKAVYVGLIWSGVV